MVWNVKDDDVQVSRSDHTRTLATHHVARREEPVVVHSEKVPPRPTPAPVDRITNDVNNDEDVQEGMNGIKEEAEELETEIKEEEQMLKDKEQELEDLLDEVKEEEPEPASTVAKPVIVDPTTPTVQPTVPPTLAPTKRPTNPPIEPGTPTVRDLQ